MMFASGCLRTMRIAARVPSAQPATRLFSTSSKTCATSPRRAAPVAVLCDDERPVALRVEASGRWRRWRRTATLPETVPFASSTVVAAIALRTSAMFTSIPASAAGSTCTRTAGCWPPPTNTCPTPRTWEIFCARMVLAASKTCDSGSVSLVEGDDEDRRVGRVHLAVRRLERQVRRELAAGGGDRRLHVARGGVDVAIQVELQRDRRAAERARRRHLGEPRDAPEAPLERRRHGRGHRLRARARQRRAHLDGREVDPRQRRDRQRVYARMPASSSAAARSEVATGRRMKGAEMFTGRLRARPPRARRSATGVLDGLTRAASHAPEAVHVQVDDGRRVERQHLRDEEPADDA